MKYFVTVKEAWDQVWEVEANNIDEAKELAEEGNGKAVEFEYSHTLDKEFWTVDEVKG
jgi:hypothetical protein